MQLNEEDKACLWDILILLTILIFPTWFGVG